MGVVWKLRQGGESLVFIFYKIVEKGINIFNNESLIDKSIKKNISITFTHRKLFFLIGSG